MKLKTHPTIRGSSINDVKPLEQGSQTRGPHVARDIIKITQIIAETTVFL
jgi:hypothetical protein